MTRKRFGKLLLLLGFFVCAGYCGTVFGSYSLSLGTFAEKEAEVLHRQLIERGYPVYVLYGDNCEVRLGCFDTLPAAGESAEKLKNDEKIVAKIVEEEDADQAQFSWDDEDPGHGVDESAITEYGDTRAQKIVSLGIELFGHPYKYGGTKIGKGIDCSYFVQSIFKKLGIFLPRTSGEQFKVGQEVKAPALQVGDLVFFKKTYYNKRRKKGVTRINHVGIYIGNGEFIHATRNVMRVTISRLDEAYFVKRFAGARRVLKT
ncbi:MAG: hypothetical protein A2219_06555 [Elusimicrobia bacterium RIFOXYA2_FULL_50_26]|nr:MAG: hypothetical protein A2219_06555 [Elusimicrobia bacterium RIFOXYA2_FULL_50_26]OGS23897.1 MAG: hypothetical protein A2314_07345 [Elusimicrobia bacterium RIFOXYB2_FULL_50_12]